MRDIAISNLEVFQVAPIDSDDCPLAARIRWGLFWVCHADCESRRSGLEPLLGTFASVCRNQSRLIQFGQALIEASDACVVEVSRLMEPHGYGTGMVLQRHPRRVFCRVGKGVGRGEQSDSRSADDYGRRRRPSAESSGWIMPLPLSDVGRSERKHVAITFPAEGPRGSDGSAAQARSGGRKHLVSGGFR